MVGKTSALTQNASYVAIGIIGKPITLGRKFIEQANMGVAMMMIVIHGLCNALFFMMMSNKISKYIYKNIDDSFSDYFNNSKVELTPPYLRIILVTVLFTLGVAIVIALMLYGFTMLTGSVTDFTRNISIAATRSAVLIPGVLVSMLIFVISVKWGIVCFMLINIIGYVELVAVSQTVLEEKSKDLMVLLFALMIILTVVIVSFLITKVWQMYLPDDVIKIGKDIIDAFERYLSLLME